MKPPWKQALAETANTLALVIIWEKKRGLGEWEDEHLLTGTRFYLEIIERFGTR